MTFKSPVYILIDLPGESIFFSPPGWIWRFILHFKGKTDQRIFVNSKSTKRRAETTRKKYFVGWQIWMDFQLFISGSLTWVGVPILSSDSQFE